MAREEYSANVIVQRTVGTNVRNIDDLNVTTTPQTVTFGVTLINYLQNKGAVPMLVEFVRGGVVIGSKTLQGGYGFSDAYLQIDALRVSTASGSATLDGLGVA